MAVSISFGSYSGDQASACIVISKPGGTFPDNGETLYCHPDDKARLITLVQDIMENGDDILQAINTELGVDKEDNDYV